MIHSTLTPKTCSAAVSVITLDPAKACVYIGRSQLNTFVVDNNDIAPFHCCFVYTKKLWHIRTKVRNCIWVNDYCIDINLLYVLFPGDTVILAKDVSYVYQMGLNDRERSPVPLDEVERVDKPDDDMVDQKWSCNICSEPFLQTTSFTCQHRFCQPCIDGWKSIRQSCPICQAIIINHLNIQNISIAAEVKLQEDQSTIVEPDPICIDLTDDNEAEPPATSTQI